MNLQIQNTIRRLSSQRKNKLKLVDIYCSAICDKIDSPGSWAAVLICGNAKKNIQGSFPRTNLNRLNLISIISSVGQLKEPCEVVIYFNSDYVFNSINNGDIIKWKQDNWKLKNGGLVQNEDIWRMLLIQIKAKKHKVKFRKVNIDDKNYLDSLKNAKIELNKYLENDIYS